jgi:hypothetical protein
MITRLTPRFMRTISIIPKVIFICTILAISGVANAALVDHGGGLIYDTDLNITWYDHSSIAPTWADAVSWVSGVTAGGVGGWRLPSSAPGPYSWGFDGTTTGGYNITSSEMGHLFYTELGNSGDIDILGNSTPVATDGSANDNFIHNSGPFTNLLFGNLWDTGWADYWSSTGASGTDGIWAFDTSYGYQDNEDKVTPSIYGPGYAMAVHEGNVPEPATMWMCLLGLGGLLFRRKK